MTSKYKKYNKYKDDKQFFAVLAQMMLARPNDWIEKSVREDTSFFKSPEDGSKITSTANSTAKNNLTALQSLLFDIENQAKAGAEKQALALLKSARKQYHEQKNFGLAMLSMASVMALNEVAQSTFFSSDITRNIFEHASCHHIAPHFPFPIGFAELELVMSTIRLVKAIQHATAKKGVVEAMRLIESSISLCSAVIASTAIAFHFIDGSLGGDVAPLFIVALSLRSALNIFKCVAHSIQARKYARKYANKVEKKGSADLAKAKAISAGLNASVGLSTMALVIAVFVLQESNVVTIPLAIVTVALTLALLISEHVVARRQNKLAQESVRRDDNGNTTVTVSNPSDGKRWCLLRGPDHDEGAQEVKLFAATD